LRWGSGGADVELGVGTATFGSGGHNSMSGWARILTVGGIVVLFLIVFFVLVPGNAVPRNPDKDKKLPTGRPDQCELLATTSNPNAAVLEPQNTWSNLAYLIAGALILYRSRTLLGAMVGLNLAFEFLFSGLYHSKLTDALDTIDVAWIYVLLLSLFVYAVQSVIAIRVPSVAKWSAETGSWPPTRPVGWALGISVVAIGLGVLMGCLKPGGPWDGGKGPFESTGTTVTLVALVALGVLPGLFWTGVRIAIPAVREDGPPIPRTVGGGITYIVKGIVLIVFVGVPTMFFRFSDGGNRLFGVNLCCSKAVLQAHATWHILSAFMVLIAYDFCAQFSGDGRIFSFASPGTENF